MSQASQVRTYDPSASVVFLKTNERFGGLSNMAPGFPLRVNGIRIRTSEALYQACRFPHLPDVQRKIIDEHSPMTAKMRSKPFRKDSRPDWDAVRVKIMRWCLRVKLAQHRREFGRLLLATGDRPIVEQSRKDDFWGAKVSEDGSLVGMNVLGRLLMELREQLKSEAENLWFIEPLAIPEFLLFGQPIEAICAADAGAKPAGLELYRPQPATSLLPRNAAQPTLFDQPTIAQGQMDIQQSNRPAEASSINSPKPYPRYHDSAHDWLRAAPEHWKLVRSKYLFREVDDRTDTGTETLLSMRQAHGLIPHTKVSTKPVTHEDLKGYKRVQAGQMVLNRMQASNGMFAVAREDGIVSPDYAVFRFLKPIEPDYFVNLFKTKIYRAKFRQESKGLGTGMSGFLRLYSDRFGTIPVPQPPPDEQRKIVEFIRNYDLHVRRLIRNKRRLIGLLNEQKQAIINRAVTRGLNPNAPMNPTGIDWMPEVPAHWEVRRLKTLADVVLGKMLKSSPSAGDQLKPYLRSANVQWYKPDTADVATMWFSQQEMEQYRVLKDDILVNEGGESGRACIWSEEIEECYIQNSVHKVTAGSEVHPLFLLYQFSNYGKLGVFTSIVNRVSISHLTREKLVAIPFCLPPKAEQSLIISHVKDATRDIDQVLDRTTNEIALINEYRERLIADIVTGKLDVRHVEIAAPADETISNEDDTLEDDDTDVVGVADAEE